MKTLPLDQFISDPHIADFMLTKTPLRESKAPKGVFPGQVWVSNRTTIHGLPSRSWVRVIRISHTSGEVGVLYGGVRRDTMEGEDLLKFYEHWEG